ncbi:MAG: hypothetical protein JSU85_01120 [Candidatus Zixiibacteriota bacterium]|nr:MAG: hypothetical protein JSU85_01120 [candidate division Zixibacteria bacterium]
MKSNIEIREQRNTTTGLMSSHKNLEKNILIRIAIHDTSDDNIVALVAVSAQNFSRIKCIPIVFVDKNEYLDSPEDPYDDLVFTKWAFDKCGIECFD